jgi:hypothetical protein
VSPVRWRRRGGRSGEWAQGVAGGEEGAVEEEDLVGTGKRRGFFSKSPTPLSNGAPLGVRHYVA